jgi:hypothetical protein
MSSGNNSPILFPTHLNKYAQCPERYHHEYREKRHVPREFSPALARGIASHTILAQAAEEYRTLGGVPANLRDLAEAKLPRASYPDSASWMADVEAVVRAAKVGISYLDGEATVLATETTMHFPYRNSGEGPSFILAAKIDLILRKQDTDGRDYLDVVDFKSASAVREDLIQEVASRIVVKHNASRRFGVADLPIVNTTLYLGADTIVSRELSADLCRATWGSMKAIVRGILCGAQFPPNPSPVCQWCPFFGNGCSAHESNGHDQQLTIWLDGAAD